VLIAVAILIAESPLVALDVVFRVLFPPVTQPVPWGVAVLLASLVAPGEGFPAIEVGAEEELVPPPLLGQTPLVSFVIAGTGILTLAITGMASSDGKAPKLATSVGLSLLSTVAVKLSSAPFVRAFKQELERVRAEDVLVADKRELGALREGQVVMLMTEA